MELRLEPFLAGGEALRERSSGRLDLLLPHTMPFNDSSLVLNAFAMPVLAAIFS